MNTNINHFICFLQKNSAIVKSTILRNTHYLNALNVLFFIFIILFIIFLYWIILVIIFKFRSRFWYIQPVYHLFDWHYIFYKNQVIMNELPEKNVFVDFKNIKITEFPQENGNENENTLTDFLRFIQTHYFKNKQNLENVFNPELNNIVPYFKYHNSKTFLSLYFKEDLNQNINGEIESSKKIIGAMTSRPLHVFITDRKSLKSFDAYYVDYLCVDKMNRKSGIAEKVIQTQEYMQRHDNQKIKVSLFKREDEITGIIPICIYKTYGFSMKNWTVSSPFSNNNYSCILCSEINIQFLYDFFYETKKNDFIFDVFIYPEITNIIELIKTRNIYITYLLLNGEIVSVYFFRKTCTYIEKNKEFISLFASIKNVDIDDNIFYEGFMVSLEKILNVSCDLKEKEGKNGKEGKKGKDGKKGKEGIKEKEGNQTYFSHLLVENISSNNIIFEKLKLHTNIMLESNTAFFFYNYINNIYKSNKVFIIF